MVVVGGTGATAMVAEACLALLEASSPTAEPVRRAAEEATRLQFKRIRTDQLSRPSTWVCRGRYLAFAGQQRQARRHLLKGLRYAEQYQMPFEAAVAHYELARLTNSDAAPERAKHLVDAHAIFERIEASQYLACVRELADDVVRQP
jgi:hypothetical protein